LNQRLGHLLEAGVLQRVPYQEHPVRYDYRLTGKGRDLWPVLVAMRQWGDRWAAPEGPPVEIVHDGCGHVAEVVSTCFHCGQGIDVHSIHAVKGPGSRGSSPLPERRPSLASQPEPAA
jgi:hypothetical protein